MDKSGLTPEAVTALNDFEAGMNSAVANLRPPPDVGVTWLRGYALAQYYIRIGWTLHDQRTAGQVDRARSPTGN